MLFNMPMFGQGGGFAPMPSGGPPAGASGGFDMSSILQGLGGRLMGGLEKLQAPLMQNMITSALGGGQPQPQMPMAPPPSMGSAGGSIPRTSVRPTRYLSNLL